jgi:hypothetical protein
MCTRKEEEIVKAEMVLGVSNVNSLITNRLHTSASLSTNILDILVVMINFVGCGVYLRCCSEV